MGQNSIEIAVKNMVCNRCVKVIKVELQKNNIDFVNVDLGAIKFKKEISEENKEKLKNILKKEGFEIVKNRESKIINELKILIIENVHYEKEKTANQNYSDFISKNLKVDYSYVSKVFSEIEGKTIEHFIIEQKIERAKELLVYGELTISQISYDLNYSSPQHLSRQFKQISGLTPTQFKTIRKRKKLDTI